MYYEEFRSNLWSSKKLEKKNIPAESINTRG